MRIIIYHHFFMFHSDFTIYCMQSLKLQNFTIKLLVNHCYQRYSVINFLTDMAITPHDLKSLKSIPILSI